MYQGQGVNKGHRVRLGHRGHEVCRVYGVLMHPRTGDALEGDIDDVEDEVYGLIGSKYFSRIDELDGDIYDLERRVRMLEW